MDKYITRFLNKGFVLSGECHIWNGTPGANGRTIFPMNGITYNGSKAAWLLFKGPVPEGLQVLHTCKQQPNCVNLNHLYLGTIKQNAQDKLKDGTHNNARKTHCKWGHEFNEENTSYRLNSGRDCKTCNRNKNKRLYHENKERINSIRKERRRLAYANKKES